MHETTDVVTWNVAGRVRGVAAQAEAVASLGAEVVLLQEVRSTAVGTWADALAAAGYPECVTSLAGGVPAADPSRRLGVLVAARGGCARMDDLPGIPWPERHAVVAVDAACGPLVAVSLHSPISSKPDLVKVRTLEAVRDWAGRTRPAGVATVLAGDLNTPQYESREGEVRSFARTRSGRLRASHGERHDAAELGLVPGLQDHGFTDAFRAVHGYGARDRSWVYPNGKMGYRLDHIFVRGLAVEDSRYVHRWREDGLSDHSALWARLAAPAGSSAA